MKTRCQNFISSTGLACGGQCLVRLLALVLVCAAGRLGGAEPDKSEATKLEYQVKAGFLFNFAKFVEWPTAGQSPPEKFRIGIVDNGEAFVVVAAALDGKSIQGRPVETIRLAPGGDVKNCEILFVARSQRDREVAVLKAVGTAPVLAVGETEKFTERGGCIGFVLKGQNVRFELNLKVAEQAGLKISSKLAAMATTVQRPEKKE